MKLNIHDPLFPQTKLDWLIIVSMGAVLTFCGWAFIYVGLAL